MKKLLPVFLFSLLCVTAAHADDLASFLAKARQRQMDFEKSLASVTCLSSSFVGGTCASSTVYNQKGKLFRSETATEGKVTIINLYDGKDGWVVDPHMRLKVTPEMISRGSNRFRRGALWNAVTAPAAQARDAGIETIDGRSCRVVEYSRGKRRARIWVDHADGVLVQELSFMDVALEDGSTMPGPPVLTRYSDFRRLAGTWWLPYASETTVTIGSDTKLVREKITDLKFNGPIDDKLFDASRLPEHTR